MHVYQCLRIGNGNAHMYLQKWTMETTYDVYSLGTCLPGLEGNKLQEYE